MQRRTETHNGSQCHVDRWPGKSLVCDACKVIVSEFPKEEAEIRTRRLSSDEYSDEVETGTCSGYCANMGRSCTGAWRAAKPGSCSEVWEYRVACSDPSPAGLAICQCSRQVTAGWRERSAKHEDHEDLGSSHDDDEAEVDQDAEDEEDGHQGGEQPDQLQKDDGDAQRPRQSQKHHQQNLRQQRSKQHGEQEHEKSREQQHKEHPVTHPENNTNSSRKQMRQNTRLGRKQNTSADDAEHQKMRHEKKDNDEERSDVEGPSNDAEASDDDGSPCAPPEDDIDYQTAALLAHIGGIFKQEDCNVLCLNTANCGAWTWGKVRNIAGLSDVCFLKSVDEIGSVVKNPKIGVVSGLPKDSARCNEVAGAEHHHLVHAAIRSRFGQCLTEKETKVQIWTCQEKNANQTWAFDAQTGQLMDRHGLCLEAFDRTKEFSALATKKCDANNWNQQWAYNNETGLIKSRKGICIDGAEPYIDGGTVYMRPCSAESSDQQWRIGPLKSTPADKRTDAKKAGSSLYCFALMMPHGYEQGLLAMQFLRKVSLFSCEAYQVLSNASIPIAPGLTSGIVESSLSCGKGGEFGTALNLDIFFAVWAKVIEDEIYLQHDWTVKVDPDAVFFPDRLRGFLTVHMETAVGVYLNNCKFGMHGPLEVFSRNAVTSWANGRKHCRNHFWRVCKGDCLWGEDLFVDQCMWKVLNVTRENDYRLLLEDHCDPPENWDSCEDNSLAAYHPFKENKAYLECLVAGR